MDNKFLNWIFNNSSVDGVFCYINFPLNLVTKNQLSIQSYADSIKVFLNLLDLRIYYKNIDLLVIEFLEKDRINIQNRAINQIYNKSFLSEIKEILTNIYQNYPVLCLEVEKQIFTAKKVDYNLFKKLYDNLTVLIAINYLNSVISPKLSFILNDSEYAPKVEKYLYKNNFSHITYFNNEFNNLKSTSGQQDLTDFCWNVGFAKDTIGNGSEFEDINYVKNLINIKEDFPEKLNPAKFYYPQIDFMEIENIEDEVELILYWAKLLQTNLEFRHYWGLRFIRNTKCLINLEKDINTWTLEDYERKYFKIK